VNEDTREIVRLYTIYRSTRTVAELTGLTRWKVRDHLARDRRVAMRSCGRPRKVVC
jgi:hypothetical protein